MLEVSEIEQLISYWEAKISLDGWLMPPTDIILVKHTLEALLELKERRGS